MRQCTGDMRLKERNGVDGGFRNLKHRSKLYESKTSDKSLNGIFRSLHGRYIIEWNITWSILSYLVALKVQNFRLQSTYLLYKRKFTKISQTKLSFCENFLYWVQRQTNVASCNQSKQAVITSKSVSDYWLVSWREKKRMSGFIAESDFFQIIFGLGHNMR